MALWLPACKLLMKHQCTVLVLEYVYRYSYDYRRPYCTRTVELLELYGSTGSTAAIGAGYAYSSANTHPSDGLHSCCMLHGQVGILAHVV